MQLSWTTFILEVINFLVLVWILRRFLYRPVLNVIARRREAVEKTLADAEQSRKEAEAVREQYERRNADWQHERDAARARLNAEIDAERRKRLDELKTELDQERDKASTAEAHRREDAARQSERVALQQATRFASRLLSLSAGPELETKLIDMLIDDLATLDETRRAKIRTGRSQQSEGILITSVHPIPTQQRARLEQSLSGILGTDAAPRYEQDPALLAGIRMTVDAWVLGANLADELQGFAEVARGD